MEAYRVPTEADFVQWDVPTWSRAVRFWDDYLGSRARHADERGLELGALRGGLSLYMAARHGVAMVCSDIRDPGGRAQPHHRQFACSDLISYAPVDACAIDYPDSTFEYVIFKSMLGEIATQDKQHLKRQVLGEVFRVLKPGGAVLFAENMRSTFVHRTLRARFRAWGRTWGYTTIEEIEALLRPFARFRLETTGFLTALMPGKTLKRVVGPIDGLVSAAVPAPYRYVIYGFAEKAA